MTRKATSILVAALLLGAATVGAQADTRQVSAPEVPEGLREIIERLSDERPAVRRAQAEELARMGERALPLLRDLLVHADHRPSPFAPEGHDGWPRQGDDDDDAFNDVTGIGGGSPGMPILSHRGYLRWDHYAPFRGARKQARLLLDEVRRQLPDPLESYAVQSLDRVHLSRSPKVLAACLCGRLGPRAGDLVGNLIPLLDAEDPMLSHTAAWALGRIGARAIRPLALACGEEETLSAWLALVELWPAHAKELIETFGKADGVRRNELLYALWFVAPTRPEEALVGVLDELRPHEGADMAFDFLVAEAYGRVAVPRLRHLVLHGAEQLRSLAFETILALYQRSTEVGPLLVDLVDRGGDEVDLLVASAVADRAVTLSREDRLALCGRLLDHGDVAVRVLVLSSLDELGPGRTTVLDRIGTLLMEGRVEQRWAAAKALAGLGTAIRPLFADLVACLDHEDPWLVAECVRRIGETEPAGAERDALIPKLEAIVGGQPLSRRRDAARHASLDVLLAMDAWRVEGVTAYRFAAWSKDEDLRRSLIALHASGLRRHPEASAQLVALLDEAYPTVREAAKALFTGPTSREVVDLVIDRFDDPRLDLRAAAILAAGADGLRGEQAARMVDALIARVRAEVRIRYRLLLLDALGHQGRASARAVPPLLELLEGDGPQGPVLKALARVGNRATAALPKLRELRGKQTRDWVTREFDDAIRAIEDRGPIR